VLKRSDFHHELERALALAREEDIPENGIALLLGVAPVTVWRWKAQGRTPRHAARYARVLRELFPND